MKSQRNCIIKLSWVFVEYVWHFNSLRIHNNFFAKIRYFYHVTVYWFGVKFGSIVLTPSECLLKCLMSELYSIDRNTYFDSLIPIKANMIAFLKHFFVCLYLNVSVILWFYHSLNNTNVLCHCLPVAL